ncbi:VTT domain-containing protein [Salimicrobium sp. PL1-032A]|uniref:TVP38/TMEM64 family protein n=1 Tax=Salimicrobium sp. PL1-032A TaxID=3095364 RepID=UPI00326183FA
MNSQKKRVRFIAVVAGVFLLLAWVNYRWQVGPEEISTFIKSFGWKAPIIYMFLYMFAPLVFFPASVLSMTAGMTYGVWPGALFIWAGAVGAASTGYLIGKFLGTRIASLRHFEVTARLQEQVASRGFLFVLTLRLIPLMGFGVLSYLSGWLGIRFHSYITATMLGILPGTLAYVTVGASLDSGNPWLIAAAVTFAACFFGAVYRYRNKLKSWLEFPGKE